MPMTHLFQPVTCLILAGILSLFLSAGGAFGADETVRKFVRYEYQGIPSFGELKDSTIHELDGNFLEGARETGKTVPLAGVRVLPPTKPEKVIAVGLNYRSHSGMAGAGNPPLFLKLPTSLVGHGAPIVIPRGATNLHYEGEMVIVIGRDAKNVSEADAHKHIFGVTAGNDVSERNWQSGDLQWVRGKAADGFGPVGPAVVTGLNYNDLLVQTRLNGDVRQSERTTHLIHSVDKIVSFISRYITLKKGDLIFTGTPGRTSDMKSGDVVEIEVEGVGVLRNPLQ